MFKQIANINVNRFRQKSQQSSISTTRDTKVMFEMILVKRCEFEKKNKQIGLDLNTPKVEKHIIHCVKRLI